MNPARYDSPEVRTVHDDNRDERIYRRAEEIRAEFPDMAPIRAEIMAQSEIDAYDHEHRFDNGDDGDGL